MDSIALQLSNGKTIGHVLDGIATIPVDRDRHWFRRFAGYSIDAVVLSQVEKVGAKNIQFLDRKTGEVCRVSVVAFRAHAVRLPDYGYGPKLVCPERFYAADAPAQGLLFGEGTYAPA